VVEATTAIWGATARRTWSRSSRARPIVRAAKKFAGAGFRFWF